MMCYCCWIWMHLLVIIKTNFRQKKCMFAIKLNFFLMSCLYGAYISIFSLSFPLHWYSFYRFGPHRKGGWLSDKKKICKREREKSVSHIQTYYWPSILQLQPYIPPPIYVSRIYSLQRNFIAFRCENSQYFYGSKRKTEQNRTEPHTHKNTFTIHTICIA